LFTKDGTKRVLQGGNNLKFGPIEEGCDCHACKNYSLAYIHHLFKAHEITGMKLASIHNVHFMVKLMGEYRERILKDQV
jgi:queuine tRNA-ribosyltransferase